MGIHKTRSIVSDSLYDKRGVPNGHELRSEGQTLTAIAERLNAAGLRPPKAAAYRWYSVQESVGRRVYHNRARREGWRCSLLSKATACGKSGQAGPGGTSKAKAGSGTRRRSRCLVVSQARFWGRGLLGPLRALRLMRARNARIEGRRRRQATVGCMCSPSHRSIRVCVSHWR